MQNASEPPICDHVELRNAQGLPTYAPYWPGWLKMHCRAFSLRGWAFTVSAPLLLCMPTHPSVASVGPRVAVVEFRGIRPTCSKHLRRLRHDLYTFDRSNHASICSLSRHATFPSRSYFRLTGNLCVVEGTPASRSSSPLNATRLCLI